MRCCLSLIDHLKTNEMDLGRQGDYIKLKRVNMSREVSIFLWKGMEFTGNCLFVMFSDAMGQMYVKKKAFSLCMTFWARLGILYSSA